MKRLSLGILISALVHAALFGGAVGFIAWRKARADNYVEIDLKGSSLLLRPQGGSSRPAARRPPESWTMGTGAKLAPKPVAIPLTETAKVEEGPTAECPPPCPAVEGDWAPAAAATRKPQWLDGMITEDDYPETMRRQNKEAVVTALVYIDAKGSVQRVELAQGADPAFNELVLSRLKASRFSPAYGPDGQAFPVRYKIPIRFELH